MHKGNSFLAGCFLAFSYRHKLNADQLLGIFTEFIKMGFLRFLNATFHLVRVDVVPFHVLIDESMP